MIKCGSLDQVRADSTAKRKSQYHIGGGARGHEYMG